MLELRVQIHLRLLYSLKDLRRPPNGHLSIYYRHLLASISRIAAPLSGPLMSTCWWLRLVHGYKHATQDPDRVTFHQKHTDFYYNSFYRRQLRAERLDIM